MSATMHDVARRAAVSTATVSRVINKPELVNPETRKHVMVAIKELGYRVNLSARRLRTNEIHNLAAVVDNLSNHTTVKVLEAFESELLKHGYNLQVCLVHNDQERMLRYLDGLTKQGQVAGILWMTTSSDPRIADQLTISGGNNVLLVDTILEEIQASHSLYFDYHTAFYEATCHLIQQGHREIHLLNLGDSQHYPAQLRQSGYVQALIEAKLKAHIHQAPASNPAAWEALSEALLRHQRPSAVLSYDDTVAAQLYRQASHHNLQIPQDISIIGCGDFPIASYLEPRLSTIRLPITQLAQQAAHCLLYGEETVIYQDFTPELILRESTA